MRLVVSLPSSEAVNPHRAPTAITYSAQAAPRMANTLGNAPRSANL